LRYREDAYDILMLWVSSQSFAQNARSSLVTTDLASSLNRSEMILEMAEMRIRGLYITRPGMEAFSCGIRAVCLCSGVNFKLEISAAEKRSLFPALADLR